MTGGLLLGVNQASVACLHPENQVQGAYQSFGVEHARQGKCSWRKTH